MRRVYKHLFLVLFLNCLAVTYAYGQGRCLQLILHEMKNEHHLVESQKQVELLVKKHARFIPQKDIDRIITGVPEYQIANIDNDKNIIALVKKSLGLSSDSHITVKAPDVLPKSGAKVIQVLEDGETISYLKIFEKGMEDSALHEIVGQKLLQGMHYHTTETQALIRVKDATSSRVALFLSPAEGKSVHSMLKNEAIRFDGTTIGTSLKELSLKNRMKLSSMDSVSLKKVKDIRAFESTRVGDVENGINQLVKDGSIDKSYANKLLEKIRDVQGKYHDSIPLEAAAIHYDLHPGNMLIKGEKVTIIDMDAATWSMAANNVPVADPLYDFSKMYYGLRYSCPKHNQANCLEAAKDLRKTYFTGKNRALEKEFEKHQEFYELRTSTMMIKHTPDCETIKGALLVFEKFSTDLEVNKYIHCN